MFPGSSPWLQKETTIDIEFKKILRVKLKEVYGQPSPLYFQDVIYNLVGLCSFFWVFFWGVSTVKKAEIKDKLSKWVSLILKWICFWILFLILNWKSKVGVCGSQSKGGTHVP